MKRLGLLILAFVFTTNLFSQKIGYINTDTVFAKLPSVQEAQKKLNSFLIQVQQEIQSKNQEYQQKATEYQQAKDTLTEFVAKKRQEELQALEKEIQKLQIDAQTEYLKMQKELLDPIKDRFYKAVEKIAKQKGYSAIIQITPQIIYYDKKYDITDLVIQELIKEEEKQSNDKK